MFITGLRTNLHRLWAVMMAGCLWAPLSVPASTDPEDIFRSFTFHIRQQIQVDKKVFVDATTCTELFYKHLYEKPAQPKLEGVSENALTLPDCRTRYPRGLQDAREDFSRTQSALSLSLTFYEFALVGDRNDDERYSARELQDIIESFGLFFDSFRPPSSHLATLNAKFDDVLKTGNLDHLMASMGVLYDKGYRFTAQDRSALDRVMG